MKRKRLDRDVGWGFQYFPYYQFRLECDEFHGLASLIELRDGEYFYWTNYEKAGQLAVAGRGMRWLQLVPDGKKRMLTAMFLPDGELSGCYVDVIESIEFDEDGVAVYVDKYLDVVFTPQGDVSLLDRDELDEAYKSGDIKKAQYDAAISEGASILAELCSDIPKSTEMLKKLLSRVYERISEDEKPIFTKYQRELTERGLIK